MSKYYVPETPLVTAPALALTADDFKGLNIIPPAKNNKIAVVFDNFLRDGIMINLVKSIFAHQPGVKIYIAEQGIHEANKEIFYTLMKEAGHEIVYAGFDAGISHSRNEAIKHVTEPFIFWCDCDEVFTEETDLKRAVYILEKNPELGVVGLEEYMNGERLHYEVDLEIKDGGVYYTPVWEERTAKTKYDFFYCDMLLNVCMVRREIFKEVRFDDNMKLAEHLDMFLQLKYNTSWKVGMSNIVIHNQGVKLTSPVYDQFRGRNKYFWQYYLDKWNLTTIVGLDNKPWKIEIFKAPKVLPQIIKGVRPTPSEKSPMIEKVEVTPLESFVLELSETLDKFNIFYLVTKKSCLEFIKRQEFTNPFNLSIQFDKHTLDKLTSMGYTYSDGLISKGGEFSVKVDDTVFKNYKSYNKIGNKVFFIPSPTIHYLKKLYKNKPEYKRYELDTLK